MYAESLQHTHAKTLLRLTLGYRGQISKESSCTIRTCYTKCSATMISYSLLLMHIALATITCTLATHPVKGDNSTEGQSNPGGCISDWRGLKKAYLDRQSSANVKNSIFDFSSMDATKYGVLVMFYDVGPPPNTSTSGRRECCQRGSEDCIIHFIYRFRIFRSIHPPLLYARIFHNYNAGYSSTSFYSTFEISQLCWSPPFCNNSWTWKEKQLYDFSEQVHCNCIDLW